MIVVSNTPPPPACASCGYSIAGLPAASGIVRCAECGHAAAPVVAINRTRALMRASLTGCAIVLNMIVLGGAAIVTVLALGINVAVHVHTFFLLALCPCSVLVLALPKAPGSFPLRIGLGIGHLVLLALAARMHFGTMAAQSYGAPAWVVAILVPECHHARSGLAFQAHCRAGVTVPLTLRYAIPDGDPEQRVGPNEAHPPHGPLDENELKSRDHPDCLTPNPARRHVRSGFGLTQRESRFITE